MDMYPDIQICIRIHEAQGYNRVYKNEIEAHSYTLYIQ